MNCRLETFKPPKLKSLWWSSTASLEIEVAVLRVKNHVGGLLTVFAIHWRPFCCH